MNLWKVFGRQRAAVTFFIGSPSSLRTRRRSRDWPNSGKQRIARIVRGARLPAMSQPSIRAPGLCARDHAAQHGVHHAELARPDDERLLGILALVKDVAWPSSRAAPERALRGNRHWRRRIGRGQFQQRDFEVPSAIEAFDCCRSDLMPSRWAVSATVFGPTSMTSAPRPC